MPWSLGVPIGLSVSLCGAILYYANKKYKKLATYLIAGGLLVSLFTVVGIYFFLL
jgi:hypothetical protein